MGVRCGCPGCGSGFGHRSARGEEAFPSQAASRVPIAGWTGPQGALRWLQPAHRPGRLQGSVRARAVRGISSQPVQQPLPGEPARPHSGSSAAWPRTKRRSTEGAESCLKTVSPGRSRGASAPRLVSAHRRQLPFLSSSVNTYVLLQTVCSFSEHTDFCSRASGIPAVELADHEPSCHPLAAESGERAGAAASTAQLLEKRRLEPWPLEGVWPSESLVFENQHFHQRCGEESVIAGGGGSSLQGPAWSTRCRPALPVRSPVPSRHKRV